MKLMYIRFMQALKITLPEGLILSEKDVLTAAATRLYDMGKLTIEQAARMVGTEPSTFVEELMAQTLQEKTAAVYHY